MNQALEPDVKAGNQHDADYDAFIDRVQTRFDKAGAVFTTDAEGLWEAYLDSFSPEERQYHNCSCCRQFITRFGGLVTIAENGVTESAMWSQEDAPPMYVEAVSRMGRLARRAKVTGPFLSKESMWGQRETGIWHHFALKSKQIYSGILTAGQAMAEKREDFKNVQYALNEFTQPMLEQALTLLKTDSLYRSEKVIGPAQWLHDLHVARTAAHGSARANVVWRAIASAPAGFCHPRSSMIGTLLEDIAAGMDFGEVSRRFAAKMAPLAYQRPQAAPTAGAIAQAEKLMEQLGAAGSLLRRYARPDDLQALWKPAQKPEAEGIFGHLKPKGSEVSELSVGPQSITWEKFRRTILPEAESIEVFTAHGRDNYVVFTTAVDPGAPPIIQWDRAEARNPVAWYIWNGGSTAQEMGLSAGIYHPVLLVTLAPHKWADEEGFSHQGKSAHFIIAGAKESRQAGSALFPEIMRSDFHGIRSVIEAYSRSKQLQGLADTHAIGLGVHASGKAGVQVRVRMNGTSLAYKIDRWD